ncbi:MAG: tetratricopeptide repeat protein [Bryobacteraceae bacterium]
MMTRRLFVCLLAGPLAGQTIDRRIAMLEKMSAAQPHNAKLRVQLGLDYLQKLRETGDGRYLDLANKAVAAVLEREPEHLDARRARNEIHLHRHLFRLVAKESEILLARSPNDPGLWANLGDALMELGQYPRAGKAYQRMTELRPDLSSHSRMAWYAFVIGNAEAAMGLMRKAIEAGSPLPEQVAWCWSELGDIQFKVGRPAEARSSFQRALALYPALHAAHAGIARLLAAEGKRTEAIASLERARAIRPQVQYCAELEELYRAAKMEKQAAASRQMLDALAKLAGARGEKADRTLAIIYADQGRELDRALALAKAEFENRDDVYSHDALGWVLHKMGKKNEAKVEMDRAVTYGTPEPMFRKHVDAIAASLARE